jgi:hypothetical protein
VRWGKEFSGLTLSIYDGAPDAAADYDQMKPLRTIELAGSCAVGNGGSTVMVDLPAAGSVFVMFRPAAGGSSTPQPPANQTELTLPVDEPWSLGFPDGWGIREGIRLFDPLASWTDPEEVGVSKAPTPAPTWPRHSRQPTSRCHPVCWGRSGSTRSEPLTAGARIHQSRKASLQTEF